MSNPASVSHGLIPIKAGDRAAGQPLGDTDFRRLMACGRFVQRNDCRHLWWEKEIANE